MIYERDLFFGALTALIIFTKWTNQKGSEVISNEAKEIFNLIEKIAVNSDKILEDMMIMSIHNKVPNDFDEERFNNFRELNVEIIKRLQLINFENKHVDTVRLINSFEGAYRNFAKLYHQSTPRILTDILNNETKYKESFGHLKKDMYAYALYKKTL